MPRFYCQIGILLILVFCCCCCLFVCLFFILTLFYGVKSETRMTASALKQAPNTWKINQNAIYQDNIQHANFRGNLLYQATKRQYFKQQLNGDKSDVELGHSSALGQLCYFRVQYLEERLTVVYVSFCSLIKGIPRKIRMLYFVLINNVLVNLSFVLIFFTVKSGHLTCE